MQFGLSLAFEIGVNAFKIYICRVLVNEHRNISSKKNDLFSCFPSHCPWKRHGQTTFHRYQHR